MAVNNKQDPASDEMELIVANSTVENRVAAAAAASLHGRAELHSASKPPFERLLAGDNYWATQVDVRDVNYEVQVPAKQAISTLANMFSRKGKTTKSVLRNVNFSLLPFESTILLGRPRSGKTSLLDILGSRRSGNISGRVTVNGMQVVDNYHRLVSYVQQGDVHLPLLTVLETFQFAAACHLDDKATIASKVNDTIDVLGLKHAANTIVGNAFTRGCSGGERRRVSIGVEWVKEASFYLLDEPTTGLDSGAAYNIGATLREQCKRGTPALAALLQPSWELVSLFDKVIILSEGEIGYWGPVTEAVAYFESLGYTCPRNYSAAEFLAEVVDEPDRFPLDPERPRLANTRQEIIAAYQKSDMYARMLREASECSTKLSAAREASTAQEYHLGSVYDATHASKYPRSRWEQVRLLLWRGGINYIRDWRRELQNIIATVFIAVVIGLIFLRLNDTLTETRAKLSLLFFLVLRSSFGALAGISALFIERPVYYRQRAAHYHAVLPWVASSFLLGIPLLVIEAILYPTITYWMGGLRPDAGHFFFTVLQCCVISIVFAGYARFWASLVPGAILASTLAATFMGVLIGFSGFLIQRPRIPEPWRWMFWVSPFSYAYSALAINQFQGHDVHCAVSELVPPLDSFQLNFAYPVGFQGNRACPIAGGVDFLLSSGLHTGYGAMWAFFVGTIAWAILWASLFYVAARWVDLSTMRITTGIDDVSKRLQDAELVAPPSHASTLSWENLCYTVPGPNGERVILDNIHGYVKPGMLLALMGASGAGKTTLLDVLARRKNVGKVSGKVLVDGRAPDSSYRRLIGYVEQTDIHFAHQTVLEAMEFAAECRLPHNVTKNQRRAIINRVLDLLSLRAIAGAYIGYGGPAGGINDNERKRLSMAVELVAEPCILFLDEPTSGLDSNAADIVMTAIQRVAQSGTSVICTIHQPSVRIFLRATHLLLLKSGGQVVYFGALGEASHTLVSYFGKQMVAPTRGQNPADFALDCSLGKAGRSEVQVLDSWRQSPEAATTLAEVRSLETNPPTLSKEHEELLVELRKPYATSFGRQLVLHTHRWSLSYWRNPFEFLMTIARAVLLGLIFGTLFYNRPHDTLGAGERFAVLFFSSLYASLTAFAYLPMVFIQRPIFYRERSERMYRTATYAIGYIASDIPMIFLGCLIYVVAFYWWTGLQREAGKFFFFLFVSFCISLVCIMFVQMIGAIFARPDTAGLIFSSVFVIFGSTAGFLIPPDKIPVFMRWLYWISFPRYFIESVAVNEFAGQQYHCPGGGFPVPINGTSFTLPYCAIAQEGPIETFGLHSDYLWVGVGVLLGYYCLFASVYILALQFINHIKR